MTFDNRKHLHDVRYIGTSGTKSDTNQDPFRVCVSQGQIHVPPGQRDQHYLGICRGPGCRPCAHGQSLPPPVLVCARPGQDGQVHQHASVPYRGTQEGKRAIGHTPFTPFGTFEGRPCRNNLPIIYRPCHGFLPDPRLGSGFLIFVGQAGAGQGDFEIPRSGS